MENYPLRVLPRSGFSVLPVIPLPQILIGYEFDVL